ncbi:MAG: phenylalanine--tRNA ligase subunit alpha, partial [Nanoarchaeota archaeon]|nr:phenylalanine--tRNA ligase subunit alpha [Nanoarchaeota archaeon]
KEAEVTTAVQLLEQRTYVNFEKNEEKIIELDKFGKNYLASDLPEIKLLKEIIDGPKKQSQINLNQEEIAAALGILKRNRLLDIKKENNGMIFSALSGAKEYLKNNKENPLKEFKSGILISNLSNKQKEILESFKMRKGFLKESVQKTFTLSLTPEGKNIAKELKEKYSNLELLELLDTDSLKQSTWKGKEFRHYDVKLETPMLDIGRRHPMLEANNILRDVFIEMGFKEMEGPMVESAFWNMDIMWIPQDHPARDEQDTFYLDGKADVSNDYIKNVKKLHEEGIKRTHTVKGDWSQDITKKRLLRTHSTATSFRTLAKLGERFKKGENVNGKYFYVAHNFRNEAIDATHLAEFFQAEGFIIADDLSLADLMGFVKEYYAKLGIDKIKFKPTFNPYTEPSMEAHYYDEKMGKWYALINSGIFRPETLKPFGLENKTVIAWGMGASRVATLLSGKTSMRDITGTTCDLEWLKTRPIMKREIVKRGDIK